MSITIKYARNGALAGIGLYLICAITLLTLSISYEKAQAKAVRNDLSVSLFSRISQALPVLFHS
ncbi:hypothetical protein D3879_09375 [Pseudomonas cavernicola]|uniref:Uncharacterized protein n=1 Tax=Pseudomonas cavernicola TaxID=2320866 RepID=A0A418XLT6_9PSED|nr:hypothetical protein [Pseudomonas cavernicola]RJG13438.1 hypothetical protein D3879_09375 [Pseudomonas cavernicola]